eukprot:scaffold185588_cov47-Prasinocladus_malaysianus.AAC.2
MKGAATLYYGYSLSLDLPEMRRSSSESAPCAFNESSWCSLRRFPSSFGRGSEVGLESCDVPHNHNGLILCSGNDMRINARVASAQTARNESLKLPRSVV